MWLAVLCCCRCLCTTLQRRGRSVAGMSVHNNLYVNAYSHSTGTDVAMCKYFSRLCASRSCARLIDSSSLLCQPPLEKSTSVVSTAVPMAFIVKASTQVRMRSCLFVIVLFVTDCNSGSKHQAQAEVLQVREQIYVTCRLVKDFQQVVHLWAQRYCYH
jgi:hypothetical protein